MHRFIVFVPALCVQRGVEWGVINVTLDVWAPAETSSLLSVAVSG